jgi:hypothetical protein
MYSPVRNVGSSSQQLRICHWRNFSKRPGCLWIERAGRITSLLRFFTKVAITQLRYSRFHTTASICAQRYQSKMVSYRDLSARCCELQRPSPGNRWSNKLFLHQRTQKWGDAVRWKMHYRSDSSFLKNAHKYHCKANPEDDRASRPIMKHTTPQSYKKNVEKWFTKYRGNSLLTRNVSCECWWSCQE